MVVSAGNDLAVTAFMWHSVYDAGVLHYDGPPRVCVLGGGFGGLYTAIKLELLMWPKGKKPKASAASQF